MKTFRRRVLVATIVLLIGAAAVPSVRHGVFRSSGLLVAEDFLVDADVGAMTSESYWSGATLDLADLLAAGRISRIVILAPVERPRIAGEFARRGIAFEDIAARAARELSSLGVPADRVIRLGADHGRGAGARGLVPAEWHPPPDCDFQPGPWPPASTPLGAGIRRERDDRGGQAWTLRVVRSQRLVDPAR